MSTQNICATYIFDGFEVIPINNNDNLPIVLFDETETELSHFLEDEVNDIEFGDATDGPIDFIKEIVEKVKTQFDDIIVDTAKKNFLCILTKILAI